MTLNTQTNETIDGKTGVQAPLKPKETERQTQTKTPRQRQTQTPETQTSDPMNPMESFEPMDPIDTLNNLLFEQIQEEKVKIQDFNVAQMMIPPEVIQARENTAYIQGIAFPTQSMTAKLGVQAISGVDIYSKQAGPGINFLSVQPQPQTETETQGTTTGAVDPDLGASKAGLGLITKWETGGKGDYSKWGDIGDGAGITAGAHQFTEKSGSLLKVAKKMGYDSIKDPEFKENLGTEKGKQAQEAVFLEKYAKPAIKKAEKLGIQDPDVKAFMIDSAVNGGLNSILKAANGDYSLENLINKRQERYDRLAKKPKLKKFARGWKNRMDDWRKLA